jgi:hypothetical protein
VTRSPNAAALLESLCRCYVERLSADDRSVSDLLMAIVVVLSAIDDGSDIPAEVAEEILGLLEGACARTSGGIPRT